ncbi:mediator of RNA polymerase II transcription subunit 12 isoform X2 [Manihot esculenta]|uniref:Uncharacterized protein n=8 Tax=Manihot esculenta TaxID=3983 RepID=A0ACB7IIH0_MANES|nr:mediator of RNA polymerase II transcription subunit 12 isoform X2 [Manihot esculenta]KAG8663818.1 hypothetical protein MANES_01G256801v8 [Manihot esculenta]KAG8663819.1 hypothetical protein MANES_01G256801v8 [Manihot esculenta]KAG8663822.1 hypothetical protein MANES_01G256801v8 [Manihot esculenta]KAG8663823.1 hypothetical protein MANES_01G256801v8 [Manihot esculenta]KAG8663824.1 hypothetical protein MANES_01G256801v8 [Manihot esculenta]
MQRYHAPSCTGAVNNPIGVASVRDTGRADSSSLPAINSRRPPSLSAYKLKCDKEPLNSRLGPPDFHPQIPNCPEETLIREYVQSGYRETVEGLEEAREVSLTHVQAFSKPVVFKCREAIRKCLRAINESRAQKRKAGQVYGVPLSGSLLTKPGVYPEQRPCSEDFKKKWIEGLSQPHKRLQCLADHVPHGYRRKSLFEVLIRNNVPLPRATWFIKVTYLNQVRPSSAGISPGTPDKTQLSRTELWTKDVIEYLQMLLDEFFSRSNSQSASHSRDRSPQMLYAGSVQHRSDPEPVFIDGEEPSLYFRWWYVVRLLHWHHAEGLLLPSVIIDWVLSQLQKKDVLEILQLLLSIIYGVLDTIVLSQTYVRALVGIAIRYIREPSPGGSDLVDNSRRAYTMSALIELLRYLILAVPDTFVALDCFPFPPSVLSYGVNDGAFVSKVSEEARKTKDHSAGVVGMFRNKGLDAQYQSLSFDQVVSSIQKQADNLAKASCPGYLVHSVATAVQPLDKVLLQGDIREAYSFLFENFCDGAVDECWIEEVSPCLRSSLKWIGTVSLSFVCSVFFLCEWATCDYRDFRAAPPLDLKFTGKKDFSQVHIASWLLKLQMRDLQSKPRRKNERSIGINSLAEGLSHHNYVGRVRVGNGYENKGNSKNVTGKNGNSSDIFESPGPLHDIIVCWIDQHEVQKGEGLKRLQLLIVELIRSGIFCPHSYVRQLIISGIMDPREPLGDHNRRKRHSQILKQLPGLFVHDVLEEARIVEGSELLEVMHVYSNERRLLLRGFLCEQYQNSSKSNISMQKQKYHLTCLKDGGSAASFDQWKIIQSCSNTLTSKKVKSNADIEELKTSILLLFQIPNLSTTSDVELDESQGSVKRAAESNSSGVDSVEATPGSEDCRRAKRQKLNEKKSSCFQGHSPISDDEDTWWMGKGHKSLDLSKVDIPQKSSKQVSKGRQKVVRKSLAQLTAARIEGSQGASASHVCDNRVGCPDQKNGTEGETLKSVDGIRTLQGGDIASIAKALKQMRYLEKRSITVWLVTTVKQLVEETERNVAKANQFTRPFVSADNRSSIRWKLGEDQLSAVLYLMDVCNDLVSASKLLLWLLPKVISNASPTINSGRNVMLLQRNVENHACEVGEAFLLSCLRRYETILVATDLIPEVLTAAMQCVAVLLASGGRVSGSAILTYSRYLLKKYANMPSVFEWDKNFKATCDKRLLSELEPSRSLDGQFGFPLGVPAGVEDLDNFLRQKISGNRITRAGISMKDIVQRHIDDAFHYYFGKERKFFNAGTQKGPGYEKSDGGYQIAQHVIVGLLDCFRQTGGAAQEGDPSLVSSAVSAIVNNIGPTMAKMPDFIVPSNHSNSSSAMASLTIAKRILRIHISCLCLLKEALGERQSRVFEIALAAEAFSALATAFSPGKSSRSQFQLSPEDSNVKNDMSNNSVRSARVTKIAAAISALVVGAVIHGVASLERMVNVFRLKEGLDVIQFIRTIKSNPNGNTCPIPAFKVDDSIEVYVHWFRLLVGNCRTLFDGLIVELLGEPSVVALSRMQRMLPLNLVFPPAYSIFAFVIWRQIILSKDLANREDIIQLYRSLTMAIGDAIKHHPFRDVCLRDSRGFYDIVATDASDAEFAAMLSGLDLQSKSAAFVPLRGRLFLNAIIDCKMPVSMSTQDDSNRASGPGGSKGQHTENKTKLLDKIVNVLDTLQPAKFHWQWVELRLLLNEQALVEKLEAQDISLADAIRASSPGPEKAAASENENNFIVIILTRLLVRPDAAPLFSELVHVFGRSLEDSMLLQAKWFLGGQDVLLGRKTIRQRLISIAESKSLSTKAQFSKPWGWCRSDFDPLTNRGDKKFEVTSLEEGEVVEDGSDTKKSGKGSTQMLNSDGFSVSQQSKTERAFIELVLPCIDQGSDESRNAFASDLIKQLNNIEQQINTAARSASKQAGSVSSGLEGPASKSSNRKVIRGGSAGMNRRTAGAADSALPPPAALRASMSLRLQLLLRLLPIICTDGEPSGRNMRHMLASVILRLLGNRVVHEDADLSFSPLQSSQSKMEFESPLETPSADLCGESLFDRLLLVLHGLLSNKQPIWLKSRSSSKLMNDFSGDSPGLDREVLESLQNDLDRMQLPSSIRWRIQSAMPVLLPSKNPLPLARTAMNVPGKSRPLPLQQENDMEIDPWTLLEDGTGSGPSLSNTAVIGSGDHPHLRATSWLKGAVRARRTDLTYIGAVDDDS